MVHPFQEHPGEGRCGRGDLRHQHGHAGHTVGGQFAAGIEAEPADPQHAGANHGQDQVAGLHRVLRIAAPLAHHQSRDQTGHAGIDVHHGATGEVEHALAAQPAATPDPVADRRVNQRHPQHHEPQHRGKLHALGKGADDQRRRDDREGQLEHREHGLRNRPAERIHTHAGHEGLAQTADEAADVVTEGQAVEVQHPQDRDQAGDGEALHHHRQCILGAHHAGVEQGQARESS